MAAANEGEASPAAPSVERALALLVEAQAMLDQLEAAPEVGARLQEVIDTLRTDAGP